MRIISITARPETQCVEPTLLLDVVVAYQYGRHLPIDLAVEVRTEDKRLLSVVRPTRMTEGQDTLSFDAQDGHGENNEIRFSAQVNVGLSTKQVDHLEGLRSRHRKGDVVLECQSEIQFLTSKTAVAYLEPAEASARGGPLPIVYNERTRAVPFFSRLTNMWVLSGDGAKTFMQREIHRQHATVTIGSGDWLHDYSAPWRTTRFVVVELPQPELLTSAPGMAERVNAAIDAAKKAAENVSRGEWNDVIEDLRPVWELLRNHADIADLLQRDGYTPDAITAFDNSVKSQFDLASKFIHRTDRSGKNIAPEIRASKEDAFVCYSFAMSLLNLVSRKAARLGTR